LANAASAWPRFRATSPAWPSNSPPTPNSRARPPAPRVSLRALTGKVLGLKRSLLQIFAVAVVLELFAIVAPLFKQMVVDDVLTPGDRDLLTVLLIGFGLLLMVSTAIGAGAHAANALAHCSPPRNHRRRPARGAATGRAGA